jgi:hypothetical protein
MNIETINERILKINEAIEVAQDNNELARLDNELEELALLKIELELDKSIVNE